MAGQENTLVRLGASLREKREELEISQYELARRCNMHRTFVAGVERGERNVSILTLKRITDQLEFSVADAFTNAGL